MNDEISQKEVSEHYVILQVEQMCTPVSLLLDVFVTYLTSDIYRAVNTHSNCWMMSTKNTHTHTQPPDTYSL